jgi:hypothetical protein
MAACCPARWGIPAAAAAADHPGNTARARDSGAYRAGALRSRRAGRDRRPLTPPAFGVHVMPSTRIPT